jgi:Asp/Glu/hydantoin racemase
MRICLINGSQWISGFHDEWLALLLSNARKVCRPDTRIEMKSPMHGLKGDNIFDFSNDYFALRNKAQMVDLIIEAEEEGFDAVVVAVGDDTGVKEARSVVEIPVIGPGESAMLLACQLGRKFGAITANMPGTGLIGLIEDKIREYGLENRVISNGVRFDVHDFSDTWKRGFEDPSFAANGVEEGTRRLVADGADVAVVLCCGIGPFCTAAGMSSVRVGNRRIPVVDAMTVGIKAAETACEIRHGLRLPFTSAAIPSKQDRNRVCGVS